MGESFMAYHPDPYVRDYHDRGMAKWLGFYLSEHTSEMEKANLSHHTIWPRKERMKDTEIAKVLETAYRLKKSVAVQLDYLDTEGHPFADIIGVVEGCEEGNLYLSAPDSSIQIIAASTIRNAAFLNSEKWSDVS